ncbi:hypothetical protein [Candidatus Aciduliprofundum boonei]|uniref:Uncharacterized protein n=1 Tax=Aciduliprofundum boonei (strain DSM 19572 / T469) TaxID=439481 RepID=B5IFQ7_ACIB4|nr:hypothetical protein [Candidatus Aciduliprofundum boonei]ADD08989.1 conserved hypothetical protein [Aciduliprofundum boonei T469]EDY34868.1 hypothetical protein ABOONEI_1134 [Aciduliprofundum boonei T469]HII55181.1 hypothetical protein [Candidatus Aciduliprofundum boonei]
MPLKFDEIAELRVLTGQVVGYRALLGYNRVAFVAMKNVLCTAIGSSMESSYISATGGECRYFVIDDNYESLAEELEKYHPNLIAVFIGGSKEFDKLREILHEFFEALAKREIDTDFLFHLYTYVKVGLDVLREDEDIRNYLADKRLMAYTANFDEGLVEIREVYLLDDDIYSEIVEEYPISFRHTRIFNQGLKGRIIKFEME